MSRPDFGPQQFSNLSVPKNRLMLHLHEVSRVVDVTEVEWCHQGRGEEGGWVQFQLCKMKPSGDPSHDKLSNLNITELYAPKWSRG